MQEKWQSEHIFLFPFAWEIEEKHQEKLFKPHQDIKNRLFKEIEGWLLEDNKVAGDLDYNKFIYFYKPVRNVIYNNDSNTIISLNYRHQICNATVVLKVDGKQYTLTLFRLRLKIYKTGIGILSFHLKNKEYSDINQVMAINSLSKCVYPPMLPLEKVRQDLYPEHIKICFKNKVYCTENFTQDYINNPGRISDFIMCLLGKKFVTGEDEAQKGLIKVEPIIGSKMITLCLYRNTMWLQKLQEGQFDQEEFNIFMFISKRSKYLEQVSYVKSPYRIYGVSPYSLICVSEKEVDSNIYDELTHLVILQKATLLNFSYQLAFISTLPKEDLVPAIQSAYEIYIQFINQMYFEEVTEDMQGSKIYDLFREQLRISEELKQLGFEMKEVHKYAELVSQAKSRLKMDILTIVGAALVLPTFVTGFFGMNIMEGMFSSWWQHEEIALWLNTYAILPVLIVVLFSTWNSRRKRSHIIFKIFVIGAILLSLSILVLLGCGLNE